MSSRREELQAWLAAKKASRQDQGSSAGPRSSARRKSSSRSSSRSSSSRSGARPRSRRDHRRAEPSTATAAPAPEATPLVSQVTATPLGGAAGGALGGTAGGPVRKKLFESARPSSKTQRRRDAAGEGGKRHARRTSTPGHEASDEGPAPSSVRSRQGPSPPAVPAERQTPVSTGSLILKRGPASGASTAGNSSGGLPSRSKNTTTTTTTTTTSRRSRREKRAVGASFAPAATPSGLRTPSSKEERRALLERRTLSSMRKKHIRRNPSAASTPGSSSRGSSRKGRSQRPAPSPAPSPMQSRLPPPPPPPPSSSSSYSSTTTSSHAATFTSSERRRPPRSSLRSTNKSSRSHGGRSRRDPQQTPLRPSMTSDHPDAAEEAEMTLPEATQQMFFLETELLQWHFALARAKHCLRALEENAMSELYAVWKDVEDHRRQIAGVRMDMERETYLQQLGDQIELQASMLLPLAPKLNEFTEAVALLHDLVYRSSHQLQSTGCVPTQPAALAEALSSCPPVKPSIQRLEPVTHFASSYERFASVLSASARDSRQAEEVLAQLKLLQAHESSLQAHMLLGAALARSGRC